MTTIVAIQGDNFCVVGTDSRVSSFDESGMAYQITTLGTGSCKVASNGRYLLGAAGDVRAINILHHAFTPPAPSFRTGGEALDGFITNKFIPSLQICFENTGYAVPDMAEDKTHMSEQSSTILVAINGVIYIIDSDYSWTSDRTGIYAIGTGSSYALGAIQALSAGKPMTVQKARTVVQKSLSITSKFDPYTGAPFQVFVQEQDEKIN